MRKFFCRVCGKEVLVCNYRTKAKYCSFVCRNIDYRGKHFSVNTEFKCGQHFSEDRNNKIRIAHKGKPKVWLVKNYNKKCEYCGNVFISKLNCRRFCCKRCSISAYKNKRVINPIIEIGRRQKISKALKGKIPKNLLYNVGNIESPKQQVMFNIIKQYFPTAKYNYRVKTNTFYRFLDVAIPEVNLDFEYNGKCHLMRNVKLNDEKRADELEKLGWKIINIDRNNFINLPNIISNIKKRLENGDVI